MSVNSLVEGRERKRHDASRHEEKEDLLGPPSASSVRLVNRSQAKFRPSLSIQRYLRFKDEASMLFDALPKFKSGDDVFHAAVELQPILIFPLFSAASLPTFTSSFLDFCP